MSAYSDAVLALSPLAYHRVGEASGTSAADASGNGYTGTYAATPTLGVAGLLAGDGDTAVSLASSARMYTSTSLVLGDTFTVLVWVKRATSGVVEIIVVGRGSTDLLFRFDVTDHLLVGKAAYGDCAVSTATISDTLAHCVAWTRNGNATDKLYLDGTDVTGTVYSRPGLGCAGLVWGNGYWDGTWQWLTATIDEPAVWTSALTAGQIAALYTAGSAVAYSYSAVLTGAGVATVAESTARSTAPTLTGAGVATIAGKKAASASLTLTGAGTATLARTSARSVAPALTGAGTATLAEAKGAKSAQTLTGAGVATLAQSTARAGAAALTGAGTATIATRKGALAAPALTGAGVLTEAVTTARSSVVTATGAGVATITATVASSSEAHSGSAVMTGAGSATIAIQTGRRSAVTATGAGAVTASITSARLVAALLSGGGVLTDVHSTARAGAVNGTGAGTVTVDGMETIPLGLAARMRIASEPVGMRIASEPVGMRIASVSDAPVIRRSA